MNLRRSALRSWIAAAGAVLACVCGASDAAEPSELETAVAAIERTGRARPADAARAAERLLATTPQQSAARLDVMTLLGLELADARQGTAARALARGLEDDWAGTGPLAASAAAAALLVRSGVETQDGNMQTADALLTDARAHLPAELAPRSRLRFLAAHAFVKKESGQLAPAMRLYQDALALADELASPGWQVDMRCGLARVYLLANQQERASALNREALAIAERSGDDFSAYRVHGTEGVLRDAAGDREGMRREFELALDHARRAGAASAESLTLSNLSDFYLKGGDFRTAFALAQQALPLTRSLGDKDGETVALFNAGVALISMHNLELGKRYVRESIAIDARRGAVSSMSVSYQEFGSFLEKAGDSAGAIEAFHRYRELYDDIVQRDQQKALVEVQEKFDAERRSRDLAVLNRENLVKGEQLRRQGLQQELWWLLAGSFVVSLAALVWLYGRVRRTNRLLAETNRELALQGERDPLTGLANRRSFYGWVRGPVQARTSAVFVLDVDHFKAVNDVHGHAAGDDVLIEVAQRLVAAVGEQGLIVRWGGEEFLVVVPGLGISGAEGLAARLLAALAETPVATLGRSISVTASIGFASFPIEPGRLAVTTERAVRLVDGALYLAKSAGRNRACGVRHLEAADDAAFDAAADALGEAAAAGGATLTLLDGPVARAAA